MRTKLVIGAVALLFAAPAFAEESDFILTNETGKAVKTVELSPAGSGTWQPNKVDAELRRESEVKAGGRTTVHFDKAGSQCKYDVKLTFADDTSAVWSGINLCDNSYITMRYKAGAPSFVAT